MPAIWLSCRSSGVATDEGCWLAASRVDPAIAAMAVPVPAFRICRREIKSCLPTSCGSPPRLLLGLDEIEVDRRPHGQVAGAIGVQLVAGPSRGALRHELRLETAGLRIKRRLVEIGDAVEQPRCANEIIERFALLVLLGKAMRGVGGAERAGER